MRPASLAHAVLAAELIDAASRIDNFLLAGIERVAGRADVEVKLLFPVGGARLEGIATAACHSNIMIGRMNFGFHDRIYRIRPQSEGPRF